MTTLKSARNSMGSGNDAAEGDLASVSPEESGDQFVSFAAALRLAPQVAVYLSTVVSLNFHQEKAEKKALLPRL